VLLEVKGLVKKYIDTDVTALGSIDLSLREGEILGIVGESGAGKTSLLRILRGVERFDAGSIRFDYLRLEPDSSDGQFLEYQKQTAIQLQRSFGLWPDSALDNVVRALHYVDVGEESMPEDDAELAEYRGRAMEVLKVVGLEMRAELWSQVLSGGEKQRLIVARQIARKPRLLLLDEPGTMTDPKSRDGLVEALKMARKAYGISIVFASHNPHIHRELADRVLLMERGKVKAEGKTEKTLEEFLSGLEKPLEKREVGGPVVLRMFGASKLYELFDYGKVFELAETNIDFRRGEIVGIIGPSTAGKTVILRMLAGLELPDKGEVALLHKGEWVALGKFGRKSLHARTHIGILHQEFDLPYWGRVLDLFAARLGIKDYKMMEDALRRAKKVGIRDEIVDALSRAADMTESDMSAKLREVGLERGVIRELFRSKDPEAAKGVALTALHEMGLEPEILERQVYQLSGGEKIRVALALAIVSNPKVLILDEPFGDLDPITLRKIANSLKRVKASFRPAIVLVSHQLDFVEEVADRCVLMVEGKVTVVGPPSEVIKRFMEDKKNEA
jgi:methyl coenzyme M reductase system subunit A2